MPKPFEFELLHICKQTGASTATICRVGKCLNYGPGGYAMVLERMEDDK